jgi:hypothetical protein
MYIGQREDEQREAINESAVEARQVKLLFLLPELPSKEGLA